MSDIGGRSGIADPADPRAFDAGHAHPDTIVPRLGGRRRWWRDARRRRMLAIADLAATGIAAGVVGITLGSGWPLIFLPFWLLIAKLLGLYDRDHRAIRHLTIDEVPGSSRGRCSASFSALVVLFLTLTPAGVARRGLIDRRTRRRTVCGRRRLVRRDALAGADALAVRDNAARALRWIAGDAGDLVEEVERKLEDLPRHAP